MLDQVDIVEDVPATLMGRRGVVSQRDIPDRNLAFMLVVHAERIEPDKV